MAPRRLSRAAQVERNRGLLLEAARRVFLARGFHGATLEAIADEAGFSKGVVYSQFESKADLFLALLEARITERAAENERVASAAADPRAAFVELFRVGERRAKSEGGWNLLLLEFRAHAARDPVSSERYSDAHARTIDGIAGLLSRLYADAGLDPPRPPRVLASFLLAVGSGAHLENASGAKLLPPDAIAELTARALGLASEES